MAKIRKDDVMESLAYALQAEVTLGEGQMQPVTASKESAHLPSAMFLKLSEIAPDPHQPRRLSDEADEDLALLAESILRHGVIQPITVRRFDNGIQIVTGERRWRASRLALATGKACERPGYDLSRIPAVLVEPQSDADRLEMQMVENLARADMSPLDTAYALQSLMETQKVSQEELGRRLGRSRTWVNQMLSKVHPDARALIEHLGVDGAGIGQNELVRLMAWWRDSDGKRAIFADLKERAEAGIELKRAVIDEVEEVWVLRNGLGLQDRPDLGLDQLREAQEWVSSSDTAKRQAFSNLKTGMSSEQALRSAYTSDMPPLEDSPIEDQPVDQDVDSDAEAPDFFDDDGEEEEGEPDFQGALPAVAAAAVAGAQKPSTEAERYGGEAEKPSAGTETHGMDWETRNAEGVSSAARAVSETMGVKAAVSVLLSSDLVSRLFLKAGRNYHPLQDDVADILDVLSLLAEGD